MNELYLVNYRTCKCEPLRSITRLSEEEALEVAKKLYEENPYDGFQRFGEGFEEYFHNRIRTEKWLYEEFIAVGGKPQTEHTLYFFVHEWDIVEKAWEGKAEKAVTRIALSEIDICDVSFTFGDSMFIVDRPDRRPLFLKDKLQEHLLSFENDIDKILDRVNQQIGHRVIEAQVWNDGYFDAILTTSSL
jgi:hypothetical protein